MRAFLILLAASVAAAPSSPQTFVIHGPTVIAFSSQFTEKQLDEDPGLATVLDDFDAYNSDAQEPCRKLGIAFQGVTGTFRVRIGNRTTTVHVGNEDMGYYLI